MSNDIKPKMVDGDCPVDCGDNSCICASTRGGMRTNGGCGCFQPSHGYQENKDMALRARRAVSYYRARVAYLEGQLALQAISTDEAEARATMQRERAEQAEGDCERLINAAHSHPDREKHITGLMAALRQQESDTHEMAGLKRKAEAERDALRVERDDAIDGDLHICIDSNCERTARVCGPCWMGIVAERDALKGRLGAEIARLQRPSSAPPRNVSRSRLEHENCTCTDRGGKQ